MNASDYFMSANYDFMLVAISLAVAIVAVYVSIDLASRIERAPQALKRDWLFAGALVLGMGIWTMHFVGMLALHLPVRLGYEVWTTLFSMLPAILAAGVALHLIQRPVLTNKRRWLGGLAMGAGIGAMHYSGMAAMVMMPSVSYNLGIVALSVVFAVIGSALAIHLAHASFHALPASRQLRKMVSALVGGLTIAGMHYLGMAATNVPLDSICISGFQGPSLPHRYNPWLLALSITIAILAAYTALDIAGRIRAAVGRVRHLWLAGGAFAMGLGIWSMHFVGMIAMHTQHQVSYDITITLISILPALAASGFALYMIARGEMSPRILGVSGLLMACGIGAMHYVGMAAMQIDPPLRYDAAFFVLSILVAVAASISALWIGFQQYNEDSLSKSVARKIGSAVLMGLAIAGMHYTGMSATHVLPASGKELSDGLDPEFIAVIAGFATFMVLLLAYVVAFYDARLAAVRAEIAANLRDANAHLEARANDLAQRMTIEIRHSAAQDKLLSSVVEQSSEAIIIIDQNNVIKSWNAAAENILGVTAATAIGVRSDELRLTSNNAPLEYFLQSQSSTDDILHVTGAITSPNGVVTQVSSNVMPHLDATGAPIGRIAVMRDVTRELAAEQALRWQATHDSLTGLENRRAFDAHVEGARITARANQAQHALLLLDLDQFKLINDVRGHHAGDQMLIGIAALLQAQVGTRDIIARMGGDEFCILLINCTHDKAVKMANNLREKIEEFRLLTGDRRFQTTVSIGLVEIADDSKSAAELLMAADAACYLAKDAGRNRVWVEKLVASETATRHQEMQQVSQIDKAIEEGRLRLYCQSIFALEGNLEASTNIEILLRMVDDDGNLVLPMAFIPAAERYGVMPRIDRWVIENVLQSCLQRRETLPAGSTFILAINISAITLADESIIQFIADCLKRSPLPAGARLCFEITETAAIANLAQAQHFINEMHKLGCDIALDDFGSGMSSFAYLKNLSIDFLKIDGSFVKDMNTDSINHAIVEAITRIGQTLNLKIVAEHVHNAATVEQLRGLGVDFGQGFYLATPIPLVEYCAQLASGSVAKTISIN